MSKTKFNANSFNEKIKKIESVGFLSFEAAFDKIEKQLKYVFDNIEVKNADETSSKKIAIYLGAQTISLEDKIKLKNIYEEAGFKFRYKEEIDIFSSDLKEDKKRYVVYLSY